MGLKRFQILIKNVAPLIIAAILLIVCGCTETKVDNSEEPIDAQLLGTWSMIEDVENSSYKIVYIFYYNFSFFTGVQNMSSKLFDISLWGTYSLSDYRIKFLIAEQNSTSDLKYSISDGGETLLLYYEDDTTFDILTREP